MSHYNRSKNHFLILVCLIRASNDYRDYCYIFPLKLPLLVTTLGGKAELPLVIEFIAKELESWLTRQGFIVSLSKLCLLSWLDLKS